VKNQYSTQFLIKFHLDPFFRKGNQMNKKFLIAYSSAAGSTAEVAQAIGEEMGQAGAQVDILPVEEVNNLAGYDGVVVGSAVRIMRVLGKTKRFLRRHRKQLGDLPVAYFIVCMTLKEETAENIAKAKEFAAPMLAFKEPVSLGLFGGCFDPDKLTGLFAKTMGNEPKEDVRDWDKIRSWAREITPLLSEAK
jgi:menaquinone-dependent protoporphyrinogen oxidase